jgi:hypothetical protein
LIRVINGVNNKGDMFRLIEEGLVGELVACIRDRVCLKLVLEAISYLLQQTKQTRHAIDLYERFYSSNLLEYLLCLITESELANICAFIIFDYSETREDYCEALTIGKGYKKLIDLLVMRINYGFDEGNSETSRFFKYIL